MPSVVRTVVTNLLGPHRPWSTVAARRLTEVVELGRQCVTATGSPLRGRCPCPMAAGWSSGTASMERRSQATLRTLAVLTSRRNSQLGPSVFTSRHGLGASPLAGRRQADDRHLDVNGLKGDDKSVLERHGYIRSSATKTVRSRGARFPRPGVDATREECEPVPLRVTSLWESKYGTAVIEADDQPTQNGAARDRAMPRSGPAGPLPKRKVPSASRRLTPVLLVQRLSDTIAVVAEMRS